MSEDINLMHEMADKFGIILPEGIDSFNLSYVRRPLFLVRGKSITREQVMEVLTGEEPLFTQGIGLERQNEYIDVREQRGVLKNAFYRRGYGWLSTWIYSDGTIGGNLIELERYPEVYDITCPYFHLARKYPFLDMVISFTAFNECCCYGCDKFNTGFNNEEHLVTNCRDFDCEKYTDKILKYREPNNWRADVTFDEIYFREWVTEHVVNSIHEDVKLTIHIHEGNTDVLIGNGAKEIFKKYNELYSSVEYDFMFSSGLYNIDRNCIFDRGFIEECLDYCGLGRGLMDIYIDNSFILPFKEGVQVVTKDWVTEQYNKWIEHK